ncbi:MAG TPA: glucose 1-dehydrogenase [Chthoniobacteraceae bacterium]|nr:glucose 1-dehydrogenase [Chthoniobacteraceae bacterium]
MKIDLSGKRAVVTGGSSGIGAAIAIALGKAGARVVVNFGSNEKAAQTVVGTIRDSGGEAVAIQANVADPASVEALFSEADRALGGLDILINNAGIDGKRAFSWEGDLESWRKVIEINLFGAYYCAREALRRMIPQKSGVILSTSSTHEKIAWSGYSAYTASKGGLSMLSKTLAQEAAPHGVRVLALAPGAIKTPINRDVWDDPAARDDLMDKIPLRRIGEPEEVAAMAVVLVSDVASYVTGDTIFVDGGMTDYPAFAHGG